MYRKFLFFLFMLLSWLHFTSVHLQINASIPTDNPFQIPGMPPMSEQDMQDMMQFFQEFEQHYNKLSPQERAELDRQAREILIKEGIDPDTLQPLPSTPPQAPIDPLPAVQPPTTSTPTEIPVDHSHIAIHTVDQASELLDSLIALLETIRLKLQIISSEDKTLTELIDTLRFHTKTINKPEHLKRLTSETYRQLYELLTELEIVLSQREKTLIAIPIEYEREQDPYAILGIPYTASSKEITDNYLLLIKKHDPKHIEELSREIGMDEEKIRRRVCSSKIKTATIREAYERLIDDKLRKQIDRERINLRAQEAEIMKTSQEAIKNLIEDIGKLVQAKLLYELEQFLLRYEPTELAHKKEMDTAEQQRLSEQSSQLSTRRPPQPSPMTSNNGYINYPSYQQPNLLSSGGNLNSWSPQNSTNASPIVSAPKTNDNGSTKTSNSKSPEKKEPEKQEKQKTPKKKQKPKKEQKEEKIDPQIEKEKNKIEEPQHKKEFDNQASLLNAELEILSQLINKSIEPNITKTITSNPATITLTSEISSALQIITDKSITEQYMKIAHIIKQAATTELLQSLKSSWESHCAKHQEWYQTITFLLNTTLNYNGPTKTLIADWQTLKTYLTEIITALEPEEQALKIIDKIFNEKLSQETLNKLNTFNKKYFNNDTYPNDKAFKDEVAYIQSISHFNEFNQALSTCLSNSKLPTPKKNALYKKITDLQENMDETKRKIFLKTYDLLTHINNHFTTNT